jgi:hypothetical protein
VAIQGGLVVAAIIAAAVSIFVFAVGYVTEGRRARRRRLDEEAVNAAIAFVAASSRRRRQLGVLNSMARRPSLVGKNLFQLDPPPEDVGNALKRYALILDDYGEAEARVRFFLPASLYGDLHTLNEMHSDLRAAIGTSDFAEKSAKVDGEVIGWTNRTAASMNPRAQ